MNFDRRMSSQFLRGSIFLSIVAASASFSFVHAQGWMPQNATMFEKSGTVAGVLPNTIQMVTDRKAKWLIQVMPGETQVKVTGTATPGFLHAGLFVRFSAEIDDAGLLKNEIKELEIFTPFGKNSTGVFINAADENAKPVGKIVAGNYEIKGKVISYQKGELQLIAGKKFAAKVASDAKITLNLQDISLAQVDDVLKVKGYYFKGGDPSPSKNRPGQALGKLVEITLSKPLTAAPAKGIVKSPKLVPKPKTRAEAKEPQVAGDPSEPPIEPDPFGLNKPEVKKKK